MVRDDPEGRRLFLASTSPRRRELLSGSGLVFEVVDPHVDEFVPDARDPAGAAVEIAERKARSVAMRVAHGFVIAADTLVWGDGWLFGKPTDRSDARRMLGVLSGRTHRVTTGYAVVQAASKAMRSGLATARVTMRRITSDEIEMFVASGEADDKAGAYGIQGAASRFITCVEGGRDTVVGLPVQDVLDALSDLGFRRPDQVIP